MAPLAKPKPSNRPQAARRPGNGGRHSKTPPATSWRTRQADGADQAAGPPGRQASELKRGGPHAANEFGGEEGAAQAEEDAEGADDAAAAGEVAHVESRARTARVCPTADSLTAWAKARRSASASAKGAPRRWQQCSR